MNTQEAETLIKELENSFLVQQGASLESAAETYDEMNDNDLYQTALAVLEAS